MLSKQPVSTRTCGRVEHANSTSHCTKISLNPGGEKEERSQEESLNVERETHSCIEISTLQKVPIDSTKMR